MATNAERQAAWRARRAAELRELRETMAGLREHLRNALGKVDFLGDELSRLRARNDALEAERARLEAEVTLALKARIAAERAQR